jgi:hypothetical protein
LQRRRPSKGEHHGQSRQTGQREKETEEICGCTRQPPLPADRRLQGSGPGAVTVGAVNTGSNARAVNRKQALSLAPFICELAKALHVPAS